MTARFLAEADEEFRDAARFYETEARGLGFAFIGETNRLLSLLDASPEIGAPIAGSLRKMPLRRFPYNLIYVHEAEGILVIAVAHHKRRPFYWRRRLRNIV